MEFSSLQKHLRNNSSSSAEIIGHNDYLITHISIYLPVKSILRFQSVSKQWSSLLTHPIFIASRKTRNFILFLERGRCYLSLKENSKNVGDDNFNNYMQNPTQDSLKVESSCNGLLLLKSMRGKEQSQRRRYYVCNPFTKKHVELMVPDILTNWVTNVQAHLAFDPRTSLSYKVIFFWRENWRSPSLCTCIYSSDTKSYSKIGYKILGVNPNFYLFGPGTYINGSIFLESSTLSSVYYFDINQESFKLLPAPSNIDTEYSIVYFGEVRGHLNMILNNFEAEPGVIETFELKEDYSGWVVKDKVDIESIAVGLFPEIMQINCSCVGHCFDFYSIKGFNYVLEEEEHEPSLIFCVGNLLLAYNPINKTTRKLCDLPFCDNINGEALLLSVYHCKESLFEV